MSQADNGVRGHGVKKETCPDNIENDIQTTQVKLKSAVNKKIERLLKSNFLLQLNTQR